MTTVYFIRHAQADATVCDQRTRPLTEKGKKDSVLVTEFLSDTEIHAVLSSPYKRTIDTVADLSKKTNLTVETVENFRGLKVESNWINDYKSFFEKYWLDFTYRYSYGESLSELRERNISALNSVLNDHKDKNIVISTHSVSLAVIINYYDKTFGFEAFISIVDIEPWVVKMDFNDDGCVGMEKIDLFNPVQKLDYGRCKVYTDDLGALNAYRYTVIFARYKDKWLYCRAKNRDCYETAGGHIEQDEKPLEGAKRELYEETGATNFDITPAFDYSVHVQTVYSNGQVFFCTDTRTWRYSRF